MVKTQPLEGRWTAEEQRRFQTAFQEYGNNWQAVSAVVRTRSAVQCRSHGQKCLNKLTPVLEECVVPESPHQVEGSGPAHALSQGSQYGESVLLAPVLDEEEWKALSETKRLTLPCDPYYFALHVPRSPYSIASCVESSLPALPAREVRTVAVQCLKSTQGTSMREWYTSAQWIMHGSKSRKDC